MKRKKVVLSKRRLKLMRRDRKVRRLFPLSDWKYVTHELTKHRSGGITRRDIDRDIEKSLKKAGDPISHRQAKHFKKIMFDYFDKLEDESEAKKAKRSTQDITQRRRKPAEELLARRREEAARATYVEAEETHNPQNLTGDRSLLPHRTTGARREAPSREAAPARRSPFQTAKQRLDGLRKSPIPPRRVAPSRFENTPRPSRPLRLSPPPSLAA